MKLPQSKSDDFWDNYHLTREEAQKQVNSYSRLPPEVRARRAMEVIEYGMQLKRGSIQQWHLHFSEREITLEYVRLIHYKTGKMSGASWQHYQKGMQKLIRQEWADRFKNMMHERNWSYDDVAQLGGFKNGAVVKASIHRKLPAFARVLVQMHEVDQNP